MAENDRETFSVVRRFDITNIVVIISALATMMYYINGLEKQIAENKIEIRYTQDAISRLADDIDKNNIKQSDEIKYLRDKVEFIQNRVTKR